MTFDDTAIEAAARALIGHRDRRESNPVATLRWPTTDLTIGYRIQAAVERIRVAERGDRAIGYKIAATNAVARTHLGIDAPFFGRLYQSTTRNAPAVLAGEAGYYRMHEPEIALRIGRDLPPGDGPYDAAAIAAATEAVLPALEIVGTCYEPWNEAGVANLAADNAAHGYWVLGAPVMSFAGIDLLDAPITLAIDGTVQAVGFGRAVDGGAFGATAWLANALAGQGRGLRAGDYVTTGTVMPPWPFAAEQDVSVDFGPLGRIELRVEA